MQTTPHDRTGTLFSEAKKSRLKANDVTPMEAPNAGGVGQNWCEFRQITRYNSKTSTVASVVNLVRSQVYHTERPPLFAARLP